MTLESYRNFVTIVECGSILAASNQLLIAQPSLSNQLKNIESYYGTKLLIRNRHKLELTDAGRTFYLYAKEICRAEEKLHNEIHNKNTVFSEHLKLSIPAGNSAFFLHHLFDDWRNNFRNCIAVHCAGSFPSRLEIQQPGVLSDWGIRSYHYWVFGRR